MVGGDCGSGAAAGVRRGAERCERASDGPKKEFFAPNQSKEGGATADAFSLAARPPAANIYGTSPKYMCRFLLTQKAPTVETAGGFLMKDLNHCYKPVKH